LGGGEQDYVFMGMQGSMFNQVEKSTYPQQIAARIRSLIQEQHLTAGDRLPSERAMAEQFGVSRSSIREGIKLLAAQGLVEIRTGNGIFITDDLTTSVLQPISWAISMLDASRTDFIETRLILEPALAALAATRASQEDKERMLETIQRLELNLGDNDKVIEADMDFHLVIANSIGNNLLCEIMEGFQSLLRPFLANLGLELEYQELALKEHKEIFDAIQKGDPQGAHRAMWKSIAKDNEIQELMFVIKGE
jgi:GntR family transcriptional repressor for pyruvate dehydrogenase complex